MPHACDIISVFEAALRRQTVAAAAAADAAVLLGAFCAIVVDLCYHRVVGDYPHHPSPLVLLALAAGPGSQVQRQLYSLLATMVKLMRVSDFTARLYYCGVAACAAAALLSGAAENQQQQQLAEAAAAEATCCSSSSGHAAAAVAMLPSVVILGRCCMQWAQQLLTLSRQQQQNRGPKLSLITGLASNLSVVQQWLGAGSTCEQLAAAGYDPPAVQQQLEQLLATLHALQENPPDTAALLATAEQFESVGLALCSFAVPCMCNNPGCTSLAGLSDLAAVSGRSCLCGGCRVARYCGRACQRAAWKRHKPVCGALSAAAAAGDGGTVAGAGEGC
jgi:hypothetical protein